MGDIFKDKMDASLENLTKVHGPKVKVDEGRKFIGFDAFKKVLDSGVDVGLARYASSLPSRAPDCRYQCRQARFLRKACGGGRSGCPQSTGRSEIGKTKECIP